MKVKRNTLLLLACLVWSVAGFNVLRIGLLAYPAHHSIVNYLLTALVFTIFQFFIFGKLVKKHTARIQTYQEEKHFFLKFFDSKSFALPEKMTLGHFYKIYAYSALSRQSPRRGCLFFQERSENTEQTFPF